MVFLWWPVRVFAVVWLCFRGFVFVWARLCFCVFGIVFLWWCGCVFVGLRFCFCGGFCGCDFVVVVMFL